MPAIAVATVNRDIDEQRHNNNNDYCNYYRHRRRRRYTEKRFRKPKRVNIALRGFAVLMRTDSACPDARGAVRGPNGFRDPTFGRYFSRRRFGEKKLIKNATVSDSSDGKVLCRVPIVFFKRENSDDKLSVSKNRSESYSVSIF